MQDGENEENKMRAGKDTGNKEAFATWNLQGLREIGKYSMSEGSGAKQKGKVDL
jgi:hypothetical protein